MKNLIKKINGGEVLAEALDLFRRIKYERDNGEMPYHPHLILEILRKSYSDYPLVKEYFNLIRRKKLWIENRDISEGICAIDEVGTEFHLNHYSLEGFVGKNPNDFFVEFGRYQIFNDFFQESSKIEGDELGGFDDPFKARIEYNLALDAVRFFERVKKQSKSKPIKK
jgi:hypothetical protein